MSAQQSSPDSFNYRSKSPADQRNPDASSWFHYDSPLPSYARGQSSTPNVSASSYNTSIARLPKTSGGFPTPGPRLLTFSEIEVLVHLAQNAYQVHLTKEFLSFCGNLDDIDVVYKQGHCTIVTVDGRAHFTTAKYSNAEASQLLSEDNTFLYRVAAWPALYVSDGVNLNQQKIDDINERVAIAINNPLHRTTAARGLPFWNTVLAHNLPIAALDRGHFLGVTEYLHGRFTLLSFAPCATLNTRTDLSNAFLDMGRFMTVILGDANVTERSWYELCADIAHAVEAGKYVHIPNVQFLVYSLERKLQEWVRILRSPIDIEDPATNTQIKLGILSQGAAKELLPQLCLNLDVSAEHMLNFQWTANNAITLAPPSSKATASQSTPCVHHLLEMIHYGSFSCSQKSCTRKHYTKEEVRADPELVITTLGPEHGQSIKVLEDNRAEIYRRLREFK